MNLHFACLYLLVLSMASAAPPAPAAHFTFDDPVGDALRGNFRYVEGVSGKAMVFDGFTTVVVRSSAVATRITNGITVEAWIAPQEYSWNQTAIVNQETGHADGYCFDLDHEGHIGFSAAVDGKWQSVVSRRKVPLLKWSHVAGSFDPAEGLAVYIDGRVEARLAVSGKFTPSSADLWLGMSQSRMGVANTEREPSRRLLARARMVFDGLIDEVKIYDRTLGSADIAAAFASLHPARAQPLAYRVMPSGPRSALRFGAFYERLRYAEPWDAMWRGAGPDVVVAFDFAPIRLVSWRGTSYVPCWVTENGNWFSNEFMERSVPLGCAESMSDKQARYSSVRILESSDARALIHWRYSPVDIDYRVPFPDSESGWGDWADEYYTVYPDGVAVRKFTGWSDVPRQKGFFEWCQSLPVLQPGQRPEDVLNPSGFLTLANMKGEARTYQWPPQPEDYQNGLPGANIQVVHFKSDYQPFLILTDRQPKITLARFKKRASGEKIQGMSMSSESAFWWWNHWPVAQLPSDGRVASVPDRPSHSWTSTQDSAPWETTTNSETQIMLCGLTKSGAGGLVSLAKSWLRAPEIRLSSNTYLSRGFDPAERAYTISSSQETGPALTLTWEANADSPVLNPALVVQGWGERPPRVFIGGKEARRGVDFRYGFERKLERTDLVVWFRIEFISPVSLRLEP